MARRSRKGQDTMTDTFADETEVGQDFDGKPETEEDTTSVSGEKAPEPDGTRIPFDEALALHAKADAFAGRALEIVSDSAKLEAAVEAYRQRLVSRAQNGAEEVRQWKANIAAAATNQDSPYPNAKRRGRGQSDDNDE